MSTGRSVKKTGQTTAESHHDLSGVCAEGCSPAQLADEMPGKPLPVALEEFAAKPAAALALLNL
jgi:hypothetical protein